MTEIITPNLTERTEWGGETDEVTNISCPIDGTLLRNRIEYDFQDYHCRTCGARYYQKDDLEPQARKYLQRLSSCYEELKKQILEKERILESGRKAGLI